MDQNDNIFYLKKTDASGQYNIQAFSFMPLVEQEQMSLEAIANDISELKTKMENLEKVIGEEQNEQPIEQQQQTTKRSRKTKSQTAS